jgi:DNA-directed RNA polymerase specialized sigma24 family protein
MVARNGLVDLLREQGRRVEPADEGRPEWDVTAEGRRRQVSMLDAPDNLAERREFASALRCCAEGLNPRMRLVWIFRVFAGLSSKEIASHPEVHLKASHVDVLLQRSRDAIRACMSQKGHDPSEIPPGTFIELWKAFRLEEVRAPEMRG